VVLIYYNTLSVLHLLELLSFIQAASFSAVTPDLAKCRLLGIVEAGVLQPFATRLDSCVFATKV